MEYKMKTYSTKKSHNSEQKCCFLHQHQNDWTTTKDRTE